MRAWPRTGRSRWSRCHVISPLRVLPPCLILMLLIAWDRRGEVWCCLHVVSLCLVSNARLSWVSGCCMNDKSSLALWLWITIMRRTSELLYLFYCCYRRTHQPSPPYSQWKPQRNNGSETPTKNTEVPVQVSIVWWIQWRAMGIRGMQGQRLYWRMDGNGRMGEKEGRNSFQGHLFKNSPSQLNWQLKSGDHQQDGGWGIAGVSAAESVREEEP